MQLSHLPEVIYIFSYIRGASGKFKKPYLGQDLLNFLKI